MSYMDCSDWDKCTDCGECLMKCPVMEMGEEEAKDEFGRLLRGEEAPRVFKECTLCFDCNNYCPEGLRPYELILQRITERDEKKPAMLPYFINGMPAPGLFQDLYSGMSFGEQEILKRWSETPKPSSDVLFVGCIGKTLCHDIQNSQVMKDLPKFGPVDVCCGELAYRGGAWDAYTDLAERALTRMSELDAERIVFYCGSCYNFMGNILPKVYGKSLPFETISLYQWLLEKLEAGELEVKRPLGYSAAIHESCYASELGPEFHESLRKLYAAAGVELVELEHNRDRAMSCGAASIARGWSILNVLREQNKKYREVKGSGAREMALNCPGCYLTMFGTSWLRGIKLHYMVDELLWALGDDISVPLRKRFPAIARSLTKRAPLALKKVRSPLPRVLS
ncbi:MAG: (Fe-S)-binding protein [Actinomycetota bacterium]